MSRNRGFTLIEALITATIVALGLVAVASIFSFAVRANISNRQMAVATALLYEKMEEFESASLDEPIWTNGDGMDQIDRDGVYVRVWRIGSMTPRAVTVIVYARNGGLSNRQVELVRATTLVSPSF